ncbi:hypothetical protein COU17_01820 [Candidatus Kaiserbacteria bacterium CG10_big_fil_rev_8_21_14_0_10_49_17]|uniref:Type II secretion system protein GspF domain-containing protein n=1 Tax=Candidatus Kaiserbacteria bacterium CG10_big_fil_rev_8_21_14_0_10_49_17 TaxID=1974609 RepID=A0A2M6WED0_9BACT|nr:MAG: hypothetical protein COU17_01820 [Candidatus Kaiserbacteria bacterium CG10_big_fil_rev_8_21_14_0_10_49_17]
MATFHYKAEREDGELFEGSLEAQDRFAVYSQVRREGGTIISLEEESDTKRLSFSRLQGMIGTVSEKEKIVMTRNLAAMVDAGLSLSRALSVLVRQGKNPVFKKVLLSIEGDIKKGTALNESLGKHPKTFSQLFISMVRAGEESGQLGEALRVVGTQMERSYNLKRKVRGALIYPSIIVVAMVIIGILMLMFVVPTLTQTFEELGAELPVSTQLIISVSSFLTEHTTTALFLMGLIILSLIGGLRTKRGKRAFDYFVLHIPIISTIAKETNAARTTRTLSSLLSAGVEVVQSLKITGEVLQNSYYKEVLAAAQEEVQTGSAISAVFARNEHLYPVLVGEMIAVGEETGKLGKLLTDIATFYEGEVEQKTKDMSTVIEPFLMIFIGAVVGFFALSMISPIYTLSEGI